MNQLNSTVISDQATLSELIASQPDTDSVATFTPGPGIVRLDTRFDIAKLREALAECLAITQFKGDLEAGFGAFSLTRRPGVELETANDLSGLFYTRVDDSYEEVEREERVDESAFTELVPTFVLESRCRQ